MKTNIFHIKTYLSQYLYYQTQFDFIFIGYNYYYMQKIFVTAILITTVLSVLPANFTWGTGAKKNYLTPSANQNNPNRCESGWAFATTNSLGARINIGIQKSGIKYPTVTLSTQLLLECDQFDFGCLGGEPAQALRWIQKNSISDSTCNSYKAKGYTNGLSCSSRSKCEFCESKDNCKSQSKFLTFSLEDIGSISGQYGMMDQIYAYGPIICGISATDEFKNYNGGIFTDKTGAYHFNHYVSIYGWGVTEKGEKYWNVQNSYGPNWGEEGNIRVRKGENNIGIETLCHYGKIRNTWDMDMSFYVPTSSYLTPSLSSFTQNYCDVSWAFSIVQAIADAQFIKTNGQVLKSFSVQALLNCGVGTCEKGGDPFEALSFIHKYGLPEQGCQQYKAQTPVKQSCSAINNCATCGGNSIYKQNCSEVKNYKRWRIFDYGSVSGEAQMKIQLQNHQTLICGIELTKAFKQYKGGVFSETTVAPKINHYVEIIGFQAESGSSSWVGRSSFGTSWGISGFFKIKTGSNNLGIESKCYWAGALL